MQLSDLAILNEARRARRAALLITDLGTGESLVEVKADRAYRAALGQGESVRFDPDRIYLFETGSGQRLR